MTPDRFRQELQLFDSRLDLVWSGEQQRWEVIGVDRRHQRYLIRAIPLGQTETLGPWILQDLYDCSPTKQGGWQRVARRLDEERQQEEAARERRRQADLAATTSEAYDAYARRVGSRISSAGMPYQVTDRRRITVNGS